MTLKCIAGIEKPDSGRIVLNGRVLFDSEKKINLPVQEKKCRIFISKLCLISDYDRRTESDGCNGGQKRRKTGEDKRAA